jgi:hypothetical protein
VVEKNAGHHAVAVNTNLKGGHIYICCRAIPLMYVVPAKKEEHDKDAKGDEEDTKDEGEPDMATRVGDAVRDAKVALLKVRSN